MPKRKPDDNLNVGEEATINEGEKSEGNNKEIDKNDDDNKQVVKKKQLEKPNVKDIVLPNNLDGKECQYCFPYMTARNHRPNAQYAHILLHYILLLCCSSCGVIIFIMGVAMLCRCSGVC